MSRRYIPLPDTCLKIASISLLIAPAAFFSADRWIWSVPHQHRLQVFWAGWWIAELAALTSVLVAGGIRGLPRLSIAALECFEMWLIYRWFNIA
jgi:hypothetical protein